MFSLWDGGAYTFGLGGLGAAVSVEVERPDVVTVEGVRPVSQVFDADPILMTRAYAGPLRELFAAEEAYEMSERE